MSFNRLNILQNIQIKMPKPQEKRKMTSNSYFSDEEPIFSDSEEEMEYSRIVFGPQNKTHDEPVVKKFCSTEVQCDLSNETPILNLIKKCANLREDEANEFQELIRICKKITDVNSSEADNTDACSCIGSTTTENTEPEKLKIDIFTTSQEFLPSRISKHCGVIENSENIPKPSKPYGDIDKDSTSKQTSKVERKSLTYKNIRKSGRVVKPPKSRYSLQLNPARVLKSMARLKDTEKERNRRVLKQLENENNINSAGRSKPTRNYAKSRKSGRKSHHSEEDIEYQYPNIMNRKSDIIDSGNVSICEKNILVDRQLPREMIRPLARNWMKTHKSFNLEETVAAKPEFSSLQHSTKVRRLYSPSHMLQPEKFLNICLYP